MDSKEHNQIIAKLIYLVQKLSNQELFDLIKEISTISEPAKPRSPKADQLFKLWDNTPWTWGLDRYNDVYRCLEVELIQRVKMDLIKLA